MGGQSYCCPDCNKWFLSRYTLGQHIKSSHPVAPQVLNKRDFGKTLPPNSSYVGRGTFAGNPYRIGVDGTRDEVIDRYIAEKSQDAAFMSKVRQLKGRHLICHCAPERCHATWLLCVANDLPYSSL